MTEQYRKIIYYCIAMLVLLVIVLLLPAEWNMHVGKSQREWDHEWSDAGDAALLADTPAERQAALHRVTKLHEYNDKGHISESRDMSWSIQIFRFAFIVAIFSLCFVVLKMVIKEIRRLNRSRTEAAEGSATK